MSFNTLHAHTSALKFIFLPYLYAFLLSLRGSVINGEQNMLEVVGENIIDLQFWSVCLCVCVIYP